MTTSEPTPANSAPETRTGKTLRVGLIQLRSGREPAANLDAAAALIREAAREGARYVQTPEVTNIMELDRKVLFEKLQEEGNDATLAALRQLARELGITLHVGSLALKVSDAKAVNRGFVIDPDGEITGRYDKIHMFDVDLGNGESYRESNAYRPGERAVLTDVDGIRLGMTICYDLRFPSLYRALAEGGAKVLTVPSAFTRPTGEAHWHILLRARAIENGAYVLAAAQGGRHENGRDTYGHSLVVDPWGRVIAEGGTDPGVILAEIDMAEVAAARARVPSLTNGRRFEIAEPGQIGHLHVVRASS
ncbi:carbon-nitrogen hydrolase family protein [Xanthobacter aminoxidans]|uniref:carbon-nitrogen hydrolase family protein n=1 Tax=Xanthobacter aminoxidans TaxID=186280 RepID=UPI00372AAFF1